MNIDTSIFKAYDIREFTRRKLMLNWFIKLPKPTCSFLQTRKNAEINAEERGNLTISLGTIAAFGEEFSEATIRALTDAGVDVIDIGLASTDQLYLQPLPCR